MSSYDQLLQLVLEKKTTEEYRLSKFKKDYKYNSKDKTIIVDGEKYKVDLDIRNPINKVKDLSGDTVSTVRRTFTSIGHQDDPIIFLDKDFFNLKNKKRMNAMLQHEVGHQKMHSLNPDSPNLNKDFIHHNTISAFISNMIYDYEMQYGKMDKETKKEAEAELKKIINSDKYLKSGTEINITRKQRDEILSNVKKLATGGHINTNEFEADRYSANRTSAKDIKRGIRDSYKQSRRESSIKRRIDGINKSALDEYGVKIADKDKNTINNIRRQLNTTGVEDTNARSKALKDKNMINAKIYKPSEVKKESVNEIKLSIFEHFSNGIITDYDKEYLLDVMKNCI